MNRAEFEGNPEAQEVFYRLQQSKSTDRFAEIVLNHFENQRDKVRIFNLDSYRDALRVSIPVGDGRVNKSYSAYRDKYGAYLRLAAYINRPDTVQLLPDSSYVFHRGETSHHHAVRLDGISQFDLHSYGIFKNKEEREGNDRDLFESIFIYRNDYGLEDEGEDMPIGSIGKYSHTIDVVLPDGMKAGLKVVSYSDKEGLKKVKADYIIARDGLRYKWEIADRYTAVYEGDREELMAIGWLPTIVSTSPIINRAEFIFPDVRMNNGVAKISMNLPKGHGLREDTIFFHVSDKIVEPRPVGHLESALTKLL